jgi:hypothetical protein
MDSPVELSPQGRPILSGAFAQVNAHDGLWSAPLTRCYRSPTEHISHLERIIHILRCAFPRRPSACVVWTRCPRPCSPSAARSTTAACARRCVECPDGTSRTLPARLGPGRMLIERGSRRAPPPSPSGPRRALPSLSVHEMTRQTTRSSPSGPTGQRKGRP